MVANEELTCWILFLFRRLTTNVGIHLPIVYEHILAMHTPLSRSAALAERGD
jgi:hypothetical protein